MKPLIPPLFLLNTFFLILWTVSCGRQDESSLTGRNFIEEARWIKAVLIEGDPKGISGVDAAVLKSHGEFLKKKSDFYQKNFVAKAAPFLTDLRPKNLPVKLVYPFGGGDLAAALVSFPDVEEITTLSLESAGDPRQLPLKDSAKIREALLDIQRVLGTYYADLDNNNVNVLGLEKTFVPSQVALSIAEASLFDYHPISLRFIRIQPSGTLHYYDDAEIRGMEATRGVKIHGGWFNPICSHAFLNMEIIYERSREPKRLIHRHLSANLDDSQFAGSPALAHLKAKGKVSAMTKAAAYLMWRDDFSSIRNYLLEHMEFMISDSTGILPLAGRKAGFEVTSYGVFNGAFVAKKDLVGKSNSLSLRDFWKKEPYRVLPFRYGYSDIYGSNHLLVFRK